VRTSTKTHHDNPPVIDNGKFKQRHWKNNNPPNCYYVNSWVSQIFNITFYKCRLMVMGVVAHITYFFFTIYSSFQRWKNLKIS